MNRFEGKNILVTGGSSGIGAAAAIAFAREGARVAITGRDAEGLARVAAELGPQGLTLVSDAGDTAAQAALVADATSADGRDRRRLHQRWRGQVRPAGADRRSAVGQQL